MLTDALGSYASRQLTSSVDRTVPIFHYQHHAASNVPTLKPHGINGVEIWALHLTGTLTVIFAVEKSRRLLATEIYRTARSWPISMQKCRLTTGIEFAVAPKLVGHSDCCPNTLAF